MSTPQSRDMNTLKTEVAQMRGEVAEARGEVAELRKVIATQTEATRELIEAWKAARSLVTFVKWGSSVVAAIGVLFAVVRNYWH